MNAYSFFGLVAETFLIYNTFLLGTKDICHVVEHFSYFISPYIQNKSFSFPRLCFLEMV